MFRALTIVAAVVAVAVSASPASAASSATPPPRTTQVVVLIGANDYGVVAPRGASKGPASAGTSNAKVRRPHAAGFSIDVGTSEAVKRVTDGTSNTLQSVQVKPTPDGIIAILIG
jgi:hypothetical protein